jgi:DNA-binding CsgD family transcriptional regulator
LNVLLTKREKDKKDLEENIVSNINKMVFPFLDKIDKSKLDSRQKALCETVRANLAEITSAFSNRLSSSYIGLTPTEIQVAALIKQGFKTKEIADCLNLSYKTIESHRENIREKIGIKKKKVNLRTFLMALE